MKPRGSLLTRFVTRLNPRSSIGAKLLASFGIVALLLVAIGAVSTYQLRSLNAELAHSLDMRLQRLSLLDAVLADIDELGQAARTALLMDSPEAARAPLAILQERRSSIGEGLQKLNAAFADEDGDGRALRETIETQSSGFLVGLIKFARELNAARATEAKQLLLVQLEPKRIAIRDAVRGFRTRETQALQARRVAAQASYENGLVAIGAIGLVALAASGLLGWALTRMIVRPLEEAVAIADAVAAGEFDRTSSRPTRDETGRLLVSIERMKEQVRAFTRAQATLAQRHDALGDIDHRLDAQQFPGEFGVLARHVNDLLDSHLAAMFQLIRTLEQYSAGDLAADMPQFPGRKAVITEAAVTMKRRLLATITTMNTTVDAASHGNLTARIDMNAPDLLFPEMLAASNRLLDANASVVADAIRMFRALEAGDLRPRVSAPYQGAFADLKAAANETMTGLGDLTATIDATAQDMRLATTELAHGNADLAARTEQQASGLEETASSMEELAAVVHRNAESSQRAQSITLDTAAAARRGGERVSALVVTMREITMASKRVHDITGVIDGIAFQTNLLALNAAVEAARAGEQGRGFAVVASEVRTLSQRAAAAAKEIKQLIDDTVTKVAQGSLIVEQTGTDMSKVVTAIESVSELVSEIAVSNSEQAAGIEQINTAIQSMDQTTQQNAALAERTTQATQGLLERAEALVAGIQHFQQDAAAPVGRRAA